MRKSIDHAGFAAPSSHALGHERRTVAFAELIASVALALCTIVAATVVTVVTAGTAPLPLLPPLRAETAATAVMLAREGRGVRRAMAEMGVWRGVGSGSGGGGAGLVLELGLVNRLSMSMSMRWSRC